MLRKLLLGGGGAAAVYFDHAATAPPPGSTGVVGSGSTVWGIWDEGSQSFSLNVFTTPGGSLSGHMTWQGAKATDSPTGPLVHYRYAGHPSCLAVSGGVAVASVVHFYAGQVFDYQGAIVIVQASGTIEHAWAELLEADSLASAKSVCSEVLNSLGGFGPLPVLDGHVTITQ
jgi:hypothetical protein